MNKWINALHFPLYTIFLYIYIISKENKTIQSWLHLNYIQKQYKPYTVSPILLNSPSTLFYNWTLIYLIIKLKKIISLIISLKKVVNCHHVLIITCYENFV